MLQVSPLLGAAELDHVVTAVLAEVEGLGALDSLLRDSAVTDVLVNGPGPVWVERHGRLEPTTTVLTRAEVDRLIERLLGPLGLRVDRASPFVDARLPDGSRLHAVVPPIAVDGPYLAVRRFGARAIALASFAPPGVVNVLTSAVADRQTIVVSGGTGAGKTTLLNALATAIPKANGSSRSKRPPSCGCPKRTSCDSKRGRRMPKGSGARRSASSCAPRSGCGPTGSWWARCAAARHYCRNVPNGLLRANAGLWRGVGRRFPAPCLRRGADWGVPPLRPE